MLTISLKQKIKFYSILDQQADDGRSRRTSSSTVDAIQNLGCCNSEFGLMKIEEKYSIIIELVIEKYSFIFQ
jgi:hypothetical protein